MNRSGSKSRRARNALACALLSSLGCGKATWAEDARLIAQRLPAVTVEGNYDNAIGTSDAASQGTVNSRLIENRPLLRPAEVLEFVPGVIVTQHSGEGKANQYFLRGFNLDHGTDFATYVGGMPVNMPTHAHGHGYTDLNFLIPELVDRIAYRKGPYYAEEGDFASAGSARISLFDRLPRGIALGTLGENRYLRGLLANSSEVGPGQMLYAIESARNDGPWDNPEDLRRTTGVLRYSFGAADTRSSITAMGYAADWNATDQIPRRAVQSGLIGRFGALDASDGGRSARYSLSYELQRRFDNGSFNLNAYAIRSRLNLYSNFTFFLENPLDGDQFEQAERRKIYGLATRRSWNLRLAGFDSVNTIGAQLRHDRLDPVGLHATVARQRAATTQESGVRQTSAGVHVENATQWTRWLRSVAGLRGDRFDFDVVSSIAANSGERGAHIWSPKLSLIFGPWSKTEYFANYGFGFHSNDARGVNARVTAKTGEPIDPARPLVRTKGGELGLRTEIVDGLQSSLALWRLKSASELVFVGDAGETEPSRANKRAGVEWNNHYIAAPWLLFDLDLAASRARFSEPDPLDPSAGNRIPGAVDKVASFGVSVIDLGRWFGQFQLRYFGARPLIEDNSVRSSSTTLAYARAGYKINQHLRLALDVFNLFDRKANDIDYLYESRLQGEPPEGVADVHFHPVVPRTLRVSLSANF